MQCYYQMHITVQSLSIFTIVLTFPYFMLINTPNRHTYRYRIYRKLREVLYCTITENSNVTCSVTVRPAPQVINFKDWSEPNEMMGKKCLRKMKTVELILM